MITLLVILDSILLLAIVFYHPMGNGNGTSNSNCFEIDDGSQDVFLDSCVAIGGARGFEIKAHDYAPAAKRVQLANCRAYENAIGFVLDILATIYRVSRHQNCP